MNSEEKLLYGAEQIIDFCYRPDMTRFDGFVPLTPMLDCNCGDFIFKDATPDSLNKFANISAFAPQDSESKSDIKSRTGEIFHLKKLTPKEYRKKTGKFEMSPYSLSVGLENKQKGFEAFLRWNCGKFQCLNAPQYTPTPKFKTEAEGTAQVLLGVQFALENMCYVYLRPDDGLIGFKVPISSLSQLKELFSLREIPDGYKRRAALRNWVAKHMRRLPNNPNEKTEIKKHLRGKTDFQWFGMSGTIYIN